MPKHYFKFKQFDIYQDKCAMKVGTDGVLLGAWCRCGSAQNILDIGTGTGLIALMLAQCSKAQIHAIDIDKNSVLQASNNFVRSNWSSRLSVECIDFRQCIVSNNNKYELIVSNPPFFVNSLKSPDERKNISKHADTIPLDLLFRGAVALMTKQSRFCIIIPIAQCNNALNISLNNELYCIRKLIVKPTNEKPAHRICLEFGYQPQVIDEQTIVIRNSTNGEYTEEYKKLTSEFYLKH